MTEASASIFAKSIEGIRRTSEQDISNSIWCLKNEWTDA